MKISMNVFAIVVSGSVLLASTATLAESPAAPGAGLDTAKQEMIANMDKRITMIQEAKTCVSAAQDRDAVKKCHETLKEDRMAMRHEHMEKRADRMEMRKAKMEERMQKKSNP